jgi:uncharacterized protein DUF4349
VSQLELVQELRAHRPVAPAELRERVLAPAPPPPPRRFEPNLRRLVPAVAFAGLAVAVGVATVIGVVHGSRGPSVTSAETAKTAKTAKPQGSVQVGSGRGNPFERAAPSAFSDKALGALAPSAGRLQQYDASLRVRVNDQSELSRRTQQALRFTRRLGGYVVSAKYAAPGKTGTSRLELRVPIQRVQAAIAAFSAYGVLVSQRIVLKDLQQRVDALGIRIRRLRARIAGGEPQAQLDRDKALLRRLTRGRQATVQRAQLASIALTMAVAAKQKHAAAPLGRFHRTLDDAGSVLVRELELLLYALLVAGPLLLLGGAGILASRSLRRRADQKLLERA